MERDVLIDLIECLGRVWIGEHSFEKSGRRELWIINRSDQDLEGRIT